MAESGQVDYRKRDASCTREVHVRMSSGPANLPPGTTSTTVESYDGTSIGFTGISDIDVFFHSNRYYIEVVLCGIS
jgi:hypothetical protein